MLAADFCTAVRLSHDSLSPVFGTRCRSPEVSMTAFHAQPPDLQLTPLMDMDFAIRRSLVRRSCLLSGFCSSARVFARRFLQTPFHIGALALRYPSPPSGWGKTFTSKLSYNARHTSRTIRRADGLMKGPRGAPQVMKGAEAPQTATALAASPPLPDRECSLASSVHPVPPCSHSILAPRSGTQWSSDPSPSGETASYLHAVTAEPFRVAPPEAAVYPNAN